MDHIAGTFPKPYYAVIFIFQKDTDDPEFAATARLVAEKAATAKGLLGMDRGMMPDGRGFSISYWDNLENIKAWRNEQTHAAGQEQAREKWYAGYTIRTCLVLDDNLFPRETGV